MDPLQQNPQSGMGPQSPMTDNEAVENNPTPQFQLVLRTSQGDSVIAASETVNDLVDQARNWLMVSPAGAALLDSQVRELILQEVDPTTGAYVDSQALPVEDKKDVISKARIIGSR